MKRQSKRALSYAALSFGGSLLAVLALWPIGVLSQAGMPTPPSAEIPAELEACLRELINNFQACLLFPGGAEPDEKTVRDASPTDIFSVSLELDEPVPLGRIRAVAIHLQIPRLLASPEMVTADGRPWQLPPLKLGTLYEDLDAWPREVCTAKNMATIYGASALSSEAPETWPVRSIHVVAPAFAIEQLLDGSFLPRARLMRAMSNQGPYLESLKRSIPREMAEPVIQTANASVPAECQSFAHQQGGKVVYGWPSRNDTIMHTYGNSNSLLVQELARLSPDEPLELLLVFENALTIESMAAFVERYAIENMLTSFHANRDPQHMALMIQLGIGMGPMADQVRYYQCKLRAAVQADPSWSDTRASSATVRLNVAATWPLLSDRNIRSVQLSSRISSSEWDRVRTQYDRMMAERQANPLWSRLDECID